MPSQYDSPCRPRDAGSPLAQGPGSSVHHAAVVCRPYGASALRRGCALCSRSPELSSVIPPLRGRETVSPDSANCFLPGSLTGASEGLGGGLPQRNASIFASTPRLSPVTDDKSLLHETVMSVGNQVGKTRTTQSNRTFYNGEIFCVCSVQCGSH